MTRLTINGKEMETLLELSEEETAAGIELRLIPIIIEMLLPHPTETIAKVDALGKVIDADLALASKNFHAKPHGPLDIGHVVVFHCGDKSYPVTTESFCEWAGIELSADQREALVTVIPRVERPIDED